MTYKPRNTNYRHGQNNVAPHASSQQFYDSRQPRKAETICGFAIPEPSR